MTDPTLQKLVLDTQPSCSQPPQHQAGGTQESSAKDNMMTLELPALLQAPPASTSSKPVSSAPQSREPNSQAHTDLLAFHGIKVRDFAYESTLPPVKPWYKPQIQPGIHSLKRTKTEEADESGHSSDSATGEGGSVTKKPRLGRVITEPDVEGQSESQSLASVPVRARGFLDLQDYIPPESQQSHYCFDSQATGSPGSQPPLLDFDSQNPSQETEPYIDTPLVTPHGSLQFFVADASDLPASQLDSIESQPPLPNLLSYAERMRPKFKDPTGLTGSLSSLSSISSISSAPSSSPPSVTRFPPPTISPTISNFPHSPALSPPPSQIRGPSPSAAHTAPTIPYQLRKRPIAAKAPRQPSKLSSRTKPTARSPPLLNANLRGHSRLTHQKSLSPQQLRPLRRTTAT